MYKVLKLKGIDTCKYTQQNKLRANNITLPLFNTDIRIFNFQVYLWAKELFPIHFQLD